MTRLFLTALFLTAGLAATAPRAESLIATRVIAGRSVIEEADIALTNKTSPGALSDARLAIGREAKVTIYPGRPILAANLTAPALVERNDIVRIKFARGGLKIETTGRALGRGARGERLRVMNLASRAVVEGWITAAGEVEVTR